MKIDAFLFLQRSDIAHFAGVAAAYAGVPQIFIDPGLVEEAIQQGLPSTNFDYRPLSVGAHLQSRITSEALARASTLDQLLCRERQHLLGDGLMQGWDQGPLRLFFIRALTAKYLGEVCDRSFPEASIGLFRPTRPQQFYFDSFLATDLFAAASGRWKVVDHYENTANWVPDSTAMCFDFEAIRERVAAAPAQAITHIPTCYSHLAHFNAEIARAFPSNIDLPSPFWDIPVRRDRALWQRVDHAPREFFDDACITYRERARRVLEEQLGPLLPNRSALATQVDLMAERCFVQAVNYQGLLRALRGSRPHFVVTDHDTGSNGPLFSVAERLGAPVTVLPHSSYPTGAIPHPVNVRVIERDGFSTPTRSVWGEKVATHGVRLGPAGQRVARSRVRTVCLLLNTMYSQGLSHIDFIGMAEFHRALLQLCERHGASVLVRLKPNAAGVSMASNALGVSADDLLTVLRAPIHEVAALSDLCISYGEPTTAGIEFLACGSYLMHTGEQLWPSDYLTSPAFVGDGTVPSFRDSAALRDIEALLADETLFRSRSAAQGERFTRRLSATDGRIFNER
ncbi:MAG: hypothetical protein ABI433_12595 [Burkholderiaceae bacterium]